MEEKTDLFGIPVPSTDRVFLTFVVIHVVISLVCVLSGFLAMLANKGGKRHSIYGKVYFWSMLSAFVTVVILSVMSWPHNIHLLSIGSLAAALTYTGRGFAKSHPKNWTRLHTIVMGMSYVLLLTGFYIDNGKNLPFWRLFPQWSFWLFPAAVGIPIMLKVLRTHPLNGAKSNAD